MDRRTFLALLLPSATAAAQSPTVAVPPTLSELLQSTRWVPTTAQTLLVIGGKQTHVLPEASTELDNSSYAAYYSRVRSEALARLGPPPQGGYALSTVAPFFGRKVVRSGKLAILVPTHRRSLNITPGTPQLDLPGPIYGLTEDSLLTLVEALDDVLLKKMMSVSGLGREDIPRRLLPLFDAILPDPLRIMRPVKIPGRPPELVLTLEGEQLQALRLRISLVSTITAFHGIDYLGTLTSLDRTIVPGPDFQTPFGSLPNVKTDLSLSRPLNQELQPQSLAIYGKNLVPFTPASALPTMLAPESLKLAISLEGISQLGELVARLGEAEGLKLMVPPPLDTWSVEWRGSPEVRTAELIHAITASITGTFRECQGSYLLTDNLAPLGPRLERLSSWINKSQQEQGTARKREFLPLEWGRFEDTTPCLIPMDWCERVAKAGPFEGITVPIASFPNREALERLIAPHRAHSPDFVPTNIKLRLDWMPHVIVPDLGAIPLKQLPGSLLGRKRHVVRRALSLKDTWPILSVADLAEAKRAVIWAKQQGTPGIALDGPPEAIAAAIAEHLLPVRAVHHLWKAQPGDPNTLKDRTIENHVVNWLSPTEPAAFDLVAARLKRYASLPGLDSLLLRDAAPPGYRFTGNSNEGLTLLGYTERNQQSFLSDYKKDIFDIAPARLYYSQLSYKPWVRFEDGEAWRCWRVTRLYEALNRLRRAIDCPAWMEGGLDYHLEARYRPAAPLPGWLIRWTELQVDSSQLWELSYNATYRLIGNAREAGTAPWLCIPVPHGSTRKAIEERLGALEFEAGDGWQGRYLDLSELSLDEAKELIAG